MIQLLGGFAVTVAVTVDGEEVAEREWRLRKARSLVKLLALEPGHRINRERALELLWPDLSPDKAQNNMYQVLHATRRVVGASQLTSVDGLLALEGSVASDVEEFEQAAAAARATRDSELYATALDKYRGELLPEDRYDSWAEVRRSALRELYCAICLELADLRAEAGKGRDAIEAVLRAIAVDPLHEAAHRSLMRLYESSGRRQEALAQYHRLRASLREQLEADPDPETRALYRELLAGPERASGSAYRQRALPTQLSTFVGRERELAELRRVFDRVRLITLIGPGGSGKTRLAIAYAERSEERYDAIWFVDLGGISDPTLVSEATATVVGIQVPSRRRAAEVLAQHLSDRKGLLILDTCEHVVEACAALAEVLLQRCPNVTVLATSREALRCDGETTWRVPGLTAARPEANAPMAQLLASESVELFVERARTAMPHFELTDANAVDVATLCFRLDGMPLAIELAAARTASLGPAQIAERLERSLDLLSAGSRTARTRQQTLRAAIGWSYDLLSDAERLLFRRLAVFAGSFSGSAVESVCADAAIDRNVVLDLLGRLVDKSLVVADDVDVGRYRLLDTIRQFAAEQLADSSERGSIEARHRSWAQALAEANDPATNAGLEGRSLERLEADLDNLRAALATGLADDPESALELALTVWRFWLDRNYVTEGSRYLAAALDVTPDHLDFRAKALLAAASLAVRRGDGTAIDMYAREAEKAARRLEEPLAQADVLHAAALIHNATGGPAASATASAESLELLGALSDDEGVAVRASALHASALALFFLGDMSGARERVLLALESLGKVHAEHEPFFEGMTFGFPVLPEGTDDAVRPVFEETIMVFHRYAREPAIAYAMANLAVIERVERNADDARALLDESLQRFQHQGDEGGQAHALTGLGNWARTFGTPALGCDWLEEALTLRRARGDERAVAITETALALVLAHAGELEDARRRFVAVSELFREADDAAGHAGALLDWGLAEEHGGDLERAGELLGESALVWERNGNAHLGGWVWYAAADVLYRTESPARAAQTLTHAKSMLTGVGDLRGARLCANHAAAKAA